MKAIVQRSTGAKVIVEEETIGAIEDGLVVLVGITEADTEADIKAAVQKIIHLRIFEDEAGKMNRSLVDIDGSVLSISQFTLYADVRKGRRPSFVKAAHPDKAKDYYDLFNQLLREEEIDVATGEFGAMMEVSLTNDGPVTIIIETEEGKVI